MTLFNDDLFIEACESDFKKYIRELEVSEVYRVHALLKSKIELLNNIRIFSDDMTDYKSKMKIIERLYPELSLV